LADFPKQAAGCMGGWWSSEAVDHQCVIIVLVSLLSLLLL
jgi:hypothetical protein